MVLGWFPCVQVTFHVECTRFVSVRFSLPCINIDVRIELTKKIIWLNSIGLIAYFGTASKSSTIYFFYFKPFI